MDRWLTIMRDSDSSHILLFYELYNFIKTPKESVKYESIKDALIVNIEKLSITLNYNNMSPDKNTDIFKQFIDEFIEFPM
jgi:hypothetical protein